MRAASFDLFHAGATRVRTPALVPEVRLGLADDLAALWRAREAWTGHPGGPAPYWGVAWPGGQALARFLLDRPDLVAGRTVLDMGSGSGLCAIAAAVAGAREVVAADTDPHACLAIARNASLNAVRVATRTEDPIACTGQWDVILAADLWYERFLAQRVTGWLAAQARGGANVYLADPGRAFFPRQGLEELACHAFAPEPGLEPGPQALARVWRFRSPAAGAAFRP